MLLNAKSNKVQVDIEILVTFQNQMGQVSFGLSINNRWQILKEQWYSQVKWGKSRM